MLKKVIFIVGLLLGLISCSVIDKLEDKQSSIFVDMTRVWNLEKQFINNIEQNVSDCELNNKLDIADNKALVFYKNEVNNANCTTKAITGRWLTYGKTLTINWDEPISGESIYQIEILELTNTSMILKRKLSNGNFLEEIYN